MNEICSLIYLKFVNLFFRWLPCFTTAQNLQRCQLCCHILNSKWRHAFRLFYKLTSQHIILLAKGWPQLAKPYHSINLILLFYSHWQRFGCLNLWGVDNMYPLWRQKYGSLPWIWSYSLVWYSLWFSRSLVLVLSCLPC